MGQNKGEPLLKNAAKVVLHEVRVLFKWKYEREGCRTSDLKSGAVSGQIP